MISPLAHVDPSAKIGKDVTIHPFAFIDADTVIGDNCVIMPYVSIMSGTRLGKNNPYIKVPFWVPTLRISAGKGRRRIARLATTTSSAST